MYWCKWTQVSWWPFSPPHGGKDKHQKLNTKKHAKVQYWKDQMLIEILKYAKFVEYQLEEHMEYDDMNKDKINPNGKH